MPRCDDWVHVFTVERPPNSGGRQLLDVGLRICGYAAPNVDPGDVRIDLVCGRDTDLRSWFRVLMRRPALQAMAARTVKKIPVEELAGEDGEPLPLTRSRPLSGDDIRALLRGGGVRFVFADVGHPFGWVDGPGLYDIWKTEVQPHLAALDAQVFLDEFPGQYAYFASLWRSPSRSRDIGPVVLLEKSH
jgi:hypothetical protein